MGQRIQNPISYLPTTKLAYSAKLIVILMQKKHGGIKADQVRPVNEAQQAELARLNSVLQVAKQKGNQLFVQNIEREIAAVERGDQSPLIDEYLTDEERRRSSL